MTLPVDIFNRLPTLYELIKFGYKIIKVSAKFDVGNTLKCSHKNFYMPKNIFTGGTIPTHTDDFIIRDHKWYKLAGYKFAVCHNKQIVVICIEE